MALSPLDVPNDEDSDQKSIAAKIKSLAVRSGSHDVSESKDKASSEATPELSERLNDEIKQRYVKGQSS